MRFKEWIKEFRQELTPLGDLASDIEIDKDFPKSNRQSDILKYLESRNAGGEAIDTFILAYRRYLRETKPSDNNAT